MAVVVTVVVPAVVVVVVVVVVVPAVVVVASRGMKIVLCTSRGMCCSIKKQKNSLRFAQYVFQ